MALHVAAWWSTVLPAHPTAAGVLSAAAQVYAHARSYRDDGDQTSLITAACATASHHARRKVFRTTLERPSRFLFPYEEVEHGSETSWAAGAVWRDSDCVRAWNAFVPGIREQLDLESELGALAGVSGGLSTIVP